MKKKIKNFPKKKFSTKKLIKKIFMKIQKNQIITSKKLI